jgi:pyruvate,water dikinase
MSGQGGYGRMYRDFGYRPDPEVLRSGFLELICGQIYLDPDRAARMFWADLPVAYKVDEVLKDKSIVESAPTQFDPNRADASFLLRLPGTLRAMRRSGRLMKTARARARESFERVILPPYLQYVRQKRAQPLDKLSTPEVIAELHERRRVVLDEFGAESLKPGFFGGAARGTLETTLVQLMGPEDGGTLCRVLTGGLEGDSTVEQNICLHQVARGAERLATFLERFGHRATGEMELAEPRWREDATYLHQMIASFRGRDGQSPAERHEHNRARRTEAEQALAETLAEWGGSTLEEDIRKELTDAQALLPFRETGKHYLMMGYELIRLAILELARRWDLGRDVFFLHLDELGRFEDESTALTAEIARRKIRWQSARRLELTDLIDSEELDSVGLPRQFEEADELTADPLAAGVATGTARIVYDPKEAGELGADAILICPSTDPGWTALFLNIRGLVVERGGALSHGAITARDFGIPAVACPDATRRIRNGAAVRVDGNRGKVTLVTQTVGADH